MRLLSNFIHRNAPLAARVQHPVSGPGSIGGLIGGRGFIKFRTSSKNFAKLLASARYPRHSLKEQLWFRAYFKRFAENNSHKSEEGVKLRKYALEIS